MKKSKTMRLASALLVLTLLSTCMISGTFAKYTTSATANDSARVAKWGVTVAATSDVFAVEYADNDSKFNGNSVVAAVDGEGKQDKVIAPGTSGTAATFSITGTPEVAVRVNITLNNDDKLKMVTIPAGTKEDGVDVTTDTAYQPVKWTLKKGSTSENEVALAGYTNVSLATIEKYFTDATNGVSKDYNANEPLGTTFGYYELSWSWDFDNNGAGTYDVQDTYLGNVAAETITNDDVVLNETFDLKISVTQID